MPIDLPLPWILVLNLAGWPVIQLSLGWAFTRMPAGWFRPGRPWAWEARGRIYERVFRVRRWKDRLPDAAPWFRGGFAKGALAGTATTYLRRFASEAWRGELCHWCALGCTPLFFLWNPWWADLIMVGYAVLANLPCILVQRYNRARLQPLLARRLENASR